MAANMIEMVEAHLLNVKRELDTLNARVSEIEAEKGKLQMYLEEGQTTLKEARGNIAFQNPQEGITVSQVDRPVVKPF